MNKKKGIVLFITISFIMAITALYLKNLNDTKKLIDNSQNSYYLNYNLKIIEDINNIITKLNDEWELYDNENFTDFLAQVPTSGIPLEFENILINLKFESIEYKCDINYIYDDSNESKRNTCIDVLNNQNINFNNFYEDTKEIYNENNTTISNTKQQNNILQSFINNNNVKNEEELKKQFTFLSDSNSTKYLKCNYDITINDNKINSIETIYALSKNSVKVKDIEINFK